MRWRKTTWGLIGWSALMAAWLVRSLPATGAVCPATGGSAAECGTYVAIAAGIVLAVWFAGAAVLSVIRLATGRPGDVEGVRWGGNDDLPPG